MSAAPPVNLDDPALYINRELSWLEFNRRVLEEAQDPAVPLLERLKFLAIFSSNLDEFFMVRVGGLQQKVQHGITRSSGADRMPPAEQLERINLTVRQLVDEQSRCFVQEVLPALEREGIFVRHRKDLTEVELAHVREFFRREVFPVLTPLAIDPGHPFPHLLNKSLNLAVLLKRPKEAEKLFAVVQVPAVLPRFVPLPGPAAADPPPNGDNPSAYGTPAPPPPAASLPPPQYVFVPLETVIRLHLAELFPGMEIEQASVFRVTRDSEYEIDDDEV